MYGIVAVYLVWISVFFGHTPCQKWPTFPVWKFHWSSHWMSAACLPAHGSLMDIVIICQ